MNLPIGRRILSSMTPVDWVSTVFALLLFLLAALFTERVDFALVATNIIIILVCIVLVNAVRAYSDAKPVRILHAFYVVPLVLLIFKTVEKVSYPMHGKDYDSLFITIDRALFGTDPTVWAWENLYLSPIAVELFQICYFSYYLMFIALAAELFVRRKQHEEYYHGEENELESYRFAIVYGFLLSYIGYLSLPGVGPRFTLHEFANLERELPGLWLTDGMRYLINAGENIRSGLTSTDAIAIVTRDIFPSGHTQMTLITMLLAFRFHTRTRWVIFVLGCGLIVSTVLLRYHYVIDVLGGAVFALFTLYTLPAMQRLFLRIRKRLRET